MLPHPYFFHKLFVDFPGASELAICLISDTDNDDYDNDDDDDYNDCDDDDDDDISDGDDVRSLLA